MLEDNGLKIIRNNVFKICFDDKKKEKEKKKEIDRRNMKVHKLMMIIDI